MRRILLPAIILFFSLSAFKSFAQPGFSPLNVAAGNGSVLVTFTTGAYKNSNGTGALQASDFTVSVSASTGGGTVSAGAVATTISGSTAGGTTLTLTFTISGVKDGSEILTVGPATNTSIYDAGGVAMQTTTTITANLRDQLAPSVTFSAPADNAFVNHKNVSYSLSEALATATITWDEVGTSVDAADPHAMSLSAAERTSGAHTNFTIATPPPLVDGGKYNIAFTGADAAGNAVIVTSNKTGVTYDISPPTVSIGAPSLANTSSTSVTYTLTFTGATGSTLVPANVTLNKTGTADGTVGVSGVSASGATVTISGISGDGTLGITIAAGVATDAGGNASAAPAASTTFGVDNTGPTVAVGAPSAADAAAGPITYTITYTGATASTLVPANVTLNKTGTADGTVGVSAVTAAGATVTISSITGDGTLGITIVAGTATDALGNTATASAASTTFNVDNIPPTPTIGSPSAASSTGADITYTLTYPGTGNTISLIDANVTLNTTGTATGTVAVSGSGGTTRTVTISGITGTGTLGITIAAGTASDAAGNNAAGAGPSTTFTVDTDPPADFTTGTVSTNAGGTVNPGYYNISNTSGITVAVPIANDNSLSSGNIQIQVSNNGAAGAFINLGGTVAIAGIGTTQNVSIADATLTGNGKYADGNTLHFRAILTDNLGNSKTGFTSGSTLVIDKTAPTISIGAASASFANNAATVTYTITYTGVDNAITLANGNVSINQTGGAGATVNVTGSGLATRTVSLTSFTGNGTVGISIAAGTASDLAGNTTASAGPSGTITVDNVAPSAFSVGTAVAATGRLRTGYYNGTNTGGVNVTVPIANDATLVNGTIQLQARVSAGVFADAGSAVTIPSANTNQTVNLSTAQISAIAGYAQNVTLEFRAIIRDRANNATTGTASTSTLFVDTQAPVISVAPKVYSGKGGSPRVGSRNSHEVIMFVVSEPLYRGSLDLGGTITTATNSKNVTGSGTQFLKLPLGSELITTTGTYIGRVETITSNTALSLVSNANTALSGSSSWTFNGFYPLDDVIDGFSVSNAAAPAAVSIGTARYINDGTTNQADAAVTNTRLIWIESSANTSEWGVAGNVTTLTYTQSNANKDGAGELVYDAAGNEMSSFSISTVNGDITPPAISPDVMTLYPRAGNPEKIVFELTEALSTPTTANAVLGFSTSTGSIANATYSEALPGECPCVITLTSTLNGDWIAGTTTVSYNPATGNVVDNATPGNELLTVSNHVIVNEAVAPVISAITIPNTQMKVGDVVAATITTDDDDSDTPVIVAGSTIAGRSISLVHPILGSTSITNTSKTVYFTITEGSADLAAGSAVATNVTLRDVANNTSATYTTDIVQANDGIDANSPRVLSINRQSATNGYSSTNGTSATSVVFRVTFSENINAASLSNADFQVANTGLGGAIVVGVPVAVTGTSVYDVTVTGYTGTGTLGLDYVDNEDANAVRDAAGNYTITSVGVTDGDFTGQTYTIVLPQPSAHPSAFAVQGGSITPVSMNLVWTDPAVGTPLPTGYMITAERSGATATVPADGTVYTTQTDLINNTTGLQYVGYGVQLANWTSLLSAENYTFRIYAYTNSGTDIDYRTVATVPSVSAATTVASNVWLNNFTPIEPASFPSTTTTSGVTVNNFRFQISDDAWGFSPQDNASTKITQITIRRNVGVDQIGNWFDALAGVELWSGSTFRTGTIDPAGNYVRFSGLYDGVTEFFGEVPDNQAKYYILKLILKSPMTGGLGEVIDNKGFSFTMNNADVVVTANSSLLQPQNDTSYPIATANTTNVVKVVATQLDFTTSPSSPQLVMRNLTSTPVAPDNTSFPRVRARDAHGNTDLDYGASITITSPIATLPATVAMTNGVASVATIQYQDEGDGTLTATTSTAAANALIPTQGVSAALTVDYSAVSTMGNSYIIPTGVPTINTTYSTAVGVYEFYVWDDNGNAGTDGSPTRISSIKITKKGTAGAIADWRDILRVDVNGTATQAGAYLSDGSGSYTNAIVTVNQSDITITNMLSTNSSSDLGYIGDNAWKYYRLYVWVKPTMTGGLPAVVDFMNFDFEVQPADISTTATSSAMDPTHLNINSGAIDVDVDATKLVFATQPSTDVLVNTDLVTAGIVEAHDANDNLDLDYTTASGVSVTNTQSLSMINVPTTFTNGVLTFPSNFRYTTIGTGTAGNGTLTVSSALQVNGLAPSPVSSNSIHVHVGTAGTITAGTFSEPNTISSLADDTHDGGEGAGLGATVFDFVINDDPAGTPSNQDDGNDTQVTAITITQGGGNTITDWTQAFERVTLDDGLGHTAIGTILSDRLNFTIGAAMGNVTDNGSKTFTLKIRLRKILGGSLRTTIDGLKFEFQVLKADVTTASTGSAILPGESELSGTTKNTVAVVATKLDFTNPVTATSGAINNPFTPGNNPVTVEARDVNGNRDRGFTGSDAQITVFSTQGNVTTDNEPALNSTLTVFNLGVFMFDPLFQYTSDVPASTIEGTITLNAGKNTLPNLTGTSPSIDITSSFESSIQLDPTFTKPATIQYVTYQEAANIQNTTTSYELMRMLLVDGSRGALYTYGGRPLNTNTDTGDGLADQDNDGAPTNLTSITLRIYHPSTLRRIALYADGLEVGSEIDVDALNLANTLPYYDFVWNGSPLTSVADDDELVLSVRASFQSTDTKLADGDDIEIFLQAATISGGSQFYNGNPANSGAPGTFLAGLPAVTPPAGSLLVRSSFGKIDVIATSLDFVTAAPAAPASPYAGTYEPLGATLAPLLPTTGASTVHARDKFALIDTDFDYVNSAISISGGSPVFSGNFVNGVLDLDGMYYTSSGALQLVVDAGPLSSATIPGDNIGNHMLAPTVDVVHVEVTQVAIPTPSNLKGGTPGAVLLGVLFTPEHATLTEPTLKKFVFSFKDNPFQTATSVTLKNFKVRQGSTDVTANGATVTLGSSTSSANLDQVIVDWGTGGVALFDDNGDPAPKTFYLVADVDVTAKIGTPSMTPQLIDNGYVLSPAPGASSATDDDIIITKGTARSAVVGTSYTFASTRPPVLLTGPSSLTMPYNGQLNVDKGIPEIQLEFDIPVWSLDGKAELYDRNTNVKVADLTAINGNFTTLNTLTPTANPIRFSIDFINGNDFQDDGLYYVTIKKGTFDNLANNGQGAGEGISDDGFNYFGGISSNAILFFKISSPNPPVLNTAANVFSNLSTVAFQTTFDQRGTAYYMVVPANSPKPSKTDMLGTTTYPGPLPFATGSYPITLINAAQTVTINFSSNLVANTSYDIWILGKNDANPTNIVASAPYGGGPTYLESGTTPTLRFTTPALANLKPGYSPEYKLCPDSYFTLTDPIIIGESNNGDFMNASPLDFNLLLPAGFEFDGVTKPTVQLIGSDFTTTSATVTWVNNTIVNIAYSNTTSGSRDKIIITNLRIRGQSGSAPGIITRFAGNALSGITNLAKIENLSVSQQEFTNSYSLDNDFTGYGFPSDAIITAIPDNYIDSDVSIAGGIRLIPDIEPANDFGVTFFSGNGVTNDVLNLGAVALNTAFDITMTHTDLNGCISTDAVQYVVYDHTAPISTKLGSAPIIGSTSTAPGGIQEALNNSAFPSDAPTASFPNSGLRINYKDLAGYKLLLLTADTVPGSTGIISDVDSRGNVVPGKGAAWQAQVRQIPQIVNENTTDTDLPTSLGFTSYKEYQWDYSHILNALSEGGSAIGKNPYDEFKDPIRTFWRGGSLGKILFTGTFQNTADLSVIVPFRQEVELFVPPIPLIEIASANQSSTDAADATVNQVDSKTPTQHINSAIYTNYAGTPVFCEAGGSITFNAFPAAVAGTSTGFFRIYDYQTFDFANGTGTQLLSPAQNSPFVDNGNGTATIDPSAAQIKNGYKDIVVAYTFQEDNSPAKGTHYLVIRITPNPVADFSTTMLCQNIPVMFTDTTPDPTPGVTIAEWIWNFGDPSSTAANPNSSTDEIPVHTYANAANYNVTLSVKTNYNCPSIVAKSSLLQVGGTPVVGFSFDGVSTADNMSFVSNSTIANDKFAQLDWDYGDGGTDQAIYSPAQSSNPTTPFTHQYGSAGSKDVKLTVTSEIGCVNSTTKTLIVLPRVAQTEYEARFEDASGNNWQTAPLSPFTKSSWNVGLFTKTFMKPTAQNEQGFWATQKQTGSYSFEQDEQSALYTPSFDISMLERPMISFDAFVDLIGSDGVIIEYSTDTKNVADPTKQWDVLGLETGEGVEWFNEKNLAGSPGNQSKFTPNFSYGWSKKADASSKWFSAKHSLQNLGNGKPDIYKANQIVFRFALGSRTPDAPQTEGFAIDNFRIGERTRIVLLENFTNLTNDAKTGNNFTEDFESSFINESFLTGANSNAVVKLDYHVAFPKPDPLNLDNQQDPGARALYYNIATTPRVRMDGEINGGGNVFSSWGTQEYSVRSLKLADAAITPTYPNFTKPDGTFDLSIDIQAKRDLTTSTILNVVLVEKSVRKSSLPSDMQSKVVVASTDYTYVVKRILPNPGGTKFTQPLLMTDAPRKFTFTLPNDLTMYGTEKDLAVVVFLQNESTKEVYQTEIFDLTNTGEVVTGIEDITTHFNVYPNPADHEMTIELPDNITEGATLQMFDQVGKIVNNATFDKGERSKTINTSTHAGGVYLLQVKTAKGVLTRKVMVLHER